MAKQFFSKHFGLNKPKNQFWNLIMLDFQYFENFSSILIEKFFWHVIQTYWSMSTSTNIVIACRSCQKTNIGKEWKTKSKKSLFFRKKTFFFKKTFFSGKTIFFRKFIFLRGQKILFFQKNKLFFDFFFHSFPILVFWQFVHAMTMLVDVLVDQYVWITCQKNFSIKIELKFSKYWKSSIIKFQNWFFGLFKPKILKKIVLPYCLAFVHPVLFLSLYRLKIMNLENLECWPNSSLNKRDTPNFEITLKNTVICNHVLTTIFSIYRVKIERGGGGGNAPPSGVELWRFPLSHLSV